MAKKLVAYSVPELVQPARPSSDAGAAPFGVRVATRAAVVPFGDRAGPTVWIRDEALRGRVLVALGKGLDETLGEHELAALTSLDARAAGVADLSGLEEAVNLEGLDIGLNPVADLRALGYLPRLRALNVDGTTADPWELGALVGLEQLSQRGAGLTVLDLGDNPVAYPGPLAGLGELRALRLDGAGGADLSPLAGLRRLRHLSVRGASERQLAPLAGLALDTLEVGSASAEAGRGR